LGVKKFDFSEKSNFWAGYASRAGTGARLRVKKFDFSEKSNFWAGQQCSGSGYGARAIFDKRPPAGTLSP
jgi:hypothetical protein